MTTDGNPPIEAEFVEEESSALTVAAPAALEAMERAQVDVMIEAAVRKPRGELQRIRQKMLSFATIDEETAESCFYTLKRRDKETGKDKLIQGPSVRLSEIALVCYGNIRAGARVISNDGKKVVAQGVCFDVENNVLVTTETARRITSKMGRTFSEDMQIVTSNAACAIARRNAVFEVIPRALVNSVFEEVKKAATGGASTVSVKREKILKRFNGMGVSHAQILGVLEKETVESIGVEELELLIGLGTAIKDGTMTIDEAFAQPAEDEPERPPLRERLAARREARKTDSARKPVESEGK